MKALEAHEIVGNWATLLLPINRDDSIDFERLEHEVDLLIAAGMDGIYSNGSACEFASQSEDEFDRISQCLAERCETASVPFQLGASHTSPQLSLERVRRAAQLRPGAIQVILPDWFPPNDLEAVWALERFAEAANGIGLVLYNPPHAKRVLGPKDLARLKAAVPALVGVKVVDGDDAWYSAMLEYVRELSVFVPGHHLARGVQRGLAAGSYSNVACLSPRGAQAWWRRMTTNLEAALETEARIEAFLWTHVLPFKREGYANPALDKLLAEVGGWCDLGTRLRWPYRSIPSEVARALRPLARDMIPELFA